MGGAGILDIILEKTYIEDKKASKLLYNKGGYMKVSDILCISLCIIVSQVTLIYTGGMGYYITSVFSGKKVGLE